METENNSYFGASKHKLSPFLSLKSRFPSCHHPLLASTFAKIREDQGNQTFVSKSTSLEHRPSKEKVYVRFPPLLVRAHVKEYFDGPPLGHKLGATSSVRSIGPGNAENFMLSNASGSKFVGFGDFFQMLVQSGASSHHISDQWIRNHFRWIICKPATYERCYPAICSGKFPTIPNVLDELKYRYEREINHCQRSAINGIREGDASPAIGLVLCVSAIHFHEASKMGNCTFVGLRILAMGSGGMKGLATVKMLADIKKGTEKRIHELFDLTCGTSTGGMLTVALGIQLMSQEQCEEIYKNLGELVFAQSAPKHNEAASWKERLDHLYKTSFRSFRVIVHGSKMFRCSHSMCSAEKHQANREFAIRDWVYVKLQPYKQSTVAIRINQKLNGGSYSDPEGLEGLANFLEHILLYASEKHPVEDSYMKFISEHGGNTNAFTASEHTNYYFDANMDGFEDALDMFAQFFIKPLRSPDATKREIKAVDSENQKLASKFYGPYKILDEISAGAYREDMKLVATLHRKMIKQGR